MAIRERGYELEGTGMATRVRGHELEGRSMATRKEGVATRERGRELEGMGVATRERGRELEGRGVAALHSSEAAGRLWVFFVCFCFFFFYFILFFTRKPPLSFSGRWVGRPLLLSLRDHIAVWPQGVPWWEGVKGDGTEAWPTSQVLAGWPGCLPS